MSKEYKLVSYIICVSVLIVKINGQMSTSKCLTQKVYGKSDV